MSFVRSTWHFPGAIEVIEYYTATHRPPGEKRAARCKPTPEQVAMANLRHREDMCRRKLRANFKGDDLYLTLTFRKDGRPADMEEAKAAFRKWTARLRRIYKNAGAELKWIRNIELGTRGAWHIHVVINRIDNAELAAAKAWEHGHVNIRHCYEEGEFRKLAAYLTKCPQTDNSLKESHYWTSRGLPVPDPDVKVIRYRAFAKPRPPKGWILEEGSFWEGVNEVTGLPCRKYAFLRIGGRKPARKKKPQRKKAAKGKKGRINELRGNAGADP